MNYELAKELKEAGFPQKFQIGDWHYLDDVKMCVVADDVQDFLDNLDLNLVFKIPTLSELIKACGGKSSCGRFHLAYGVGDKWIASLCGKEEITDVVNEMIANLIEEGSIPEEAVGKLWLSLNKKS